MDSFREMEIERSEEMKQEKKTDDKKSVSSSTPAVKEEPTLSYAQQKEREKEIRRLRNVVAKLEDDIASTEERIALMDSMFASPTVAPTDDDYAQYQVLKESLERKMKDWEEATITLEEAESK